MPINVVGGKIPLRERRSFGEEWAEYEAKILPKDAPLIQRIETKRAFYMGAFLLFNLINGALDTDREPTDLDIAYLETINQEMVEFYKRMGEGKE
jgi:hypothetical protein